jgi:hypothetical protein
MALANGSSRTSLRTRARRMVTNATYKMTGARRAALKKAQQASATARRKSRAAKRTAGNVQQRAGRLMRAIGRRTGLRRSRNTNNLGTRRGG